VSKYIAVMLESNVRKVSRKARERRFSPLTHKDKLMNISMSATIYIYRMLLCICAHIYRNIQKHRQTHVYESRGYACVCVDVCVLCACVCVCMCVYAFAYYIRCSQGFLNVPMCLYLCMCV